jgi:predicted XRE-type DNA-binding protein
MSQNSSFMKWIDSQLDADPQFRAQVNQTLGELQVQQDLIALREERGLSQRQLARMLGVRQPVIAKMESGKAKNLELRTLVRAATALGAQVKIAIRKKPGRTRKFPGRAAMRRCSSPQGTKNTKFTNKLPSRPW